MLQFVLSNLSTFFTNELSLKICPFPLKPTLSVISKFQIQWNSVITNSLGPTKIVRYNREIIITGLVHGTIHRFGPKMFVHYNREFIITEFVITEFDCIFAKFITHKNAIIKWLVQIDFHCKTFLFWTCIFKQYMSFFFVYMILIVLFSSAKLK